VTINATTNLTTGGITGITNDGTSNSITVSGSAIKVDLGTLDADVDSVNASGLSAGGVVVTLGAAGQAVTGGAGADTVSVAALAVTKSLVGGDGTDTIEFTASTNYSTTAAKATGFEVLRGSGVGASYDVTSLAGITALEAETTAGALTFSGVSAAQASKVTVIGDVTTLTIGLSDSSGSSDAVSVTLDNDATTATAVTVTALTAAGVETLNIVSGDALNSGTANVVSALTGSTSVKTINVSGTSDLTITDMAAAASSAVVDASSFSKILTVGIGSGDSVKGGSGDDTVNVAFGNLGTTTGFSGGKGDDTLNVTGDASDIVDADFAAVSGVDNLTIASATSTSVTLAGYAQSAIQSIDKNSDGRLDLTATSLTINSTIDASGLTASGVDIVAKVTNVDAAGAVAVVLKGGAIADTITWTTDDTADAGGNDNVTVSIDAGNGIDVVKVTLTAADVLDVVTFVSNATKLANADIITGFVANSAGTLYDYDASLTDTLDGNEVSGLTLNAGLATTAGSVYIVTTDVANSGSNTQGDAFTAVLNSDATNLAANYAILEEKLLATSGALNGTFSNLDAAIANDTNALIALDNGTGTIILRIVNTTATANTILASEIDLVGVFTNAAGLTAADFV
jgi:hypothetical protein